MMVEQEKNIFYINSLKTKRVFVKLHVQWVILFVLINPLYTTRAQQNVLTVLIFCSYNKFSR